MATLSVAPVAPAMRMVVFTISGVSSAYLPWISRPSGTSGPTGISSYFAKPPAHERQRVQLRLCLIDRFDVHEKDHAGRVWRYQNCSILPSR